RQSPLRAARRRWGRKSAHRLRAARLLQRCSPRPARRGRGPHRSRRLPCLCPANPTGTCQAPARRPGNSPRPSLLRLPAQDASASSALICRQVERGELVPEAFGQRRADGCEVLSQLRRRLGAGERALNQGLAQAELKRDGDWGEIALAAPAVEAAGGVQVALRWPKAPITDK